MIDCLFVGIGGFIGSVLRYLAGLIPYQPDSGFPIKTLAINIIGSFLLGLLAALAAKFEGFDPRVLLMLRAGLCGGFTTFSTFAYETGELFKAGNILTGIIYIALSVILGVLAAVAAQYIVK